MMWPKIRFHLIVVVPAAVLMALEIVSSRLLAPELGTSVYVWGSIISVFLAAMSAGYFWGGRLADRDPDLPKLAGVLLVAACFQALILLFGEWAVSAVINALGTGPLGTLASATVIFAPPTVALAMVSPFVIRIAALDLQDLGATAGRLYALSTAGSLAGTLGATFVLIPSLPLRPILGLLLATTVLSALLVLPPARARLQWLLAISLLLLALLPERLLRSTEIEVVAQRMTAYQTLKVTESEGVRYLHSDGALHGAVDLASGGPHIPYPKEVPAAYLLKPELETVALIGVGSGSVGNYLLAADPDLVIDQVDIDPAVIDFAVEHFNARHDEHSRMHAADGRRFLLNRPNQRWDFIYLDTYIGHSIPFHLSTVELFELVKARLQPGGVVGLNFAGSLDSPLSKSLLRTMEEVFPFVYVFGIQGGNYLYAATAQGPRLDAEDLLERGRALDARFDFEVTGVEIARDLQLLDLDLSDVPVLEDRFAPVNHLRRFEEPTR